jgi:threonine dehydratase
VKEFRPPTFRDVLDARRGIARHLARTPLFRYPALDAELGCEVWVKHENHLPIVSFKVRGGVHLVSRLSAAERRGGIVSASTGNHGLSIAWAGREFGVRVVIVVPTGANPTKVAAMRALGAEVRHEGKDFDAAREHVERIAPGEGLRYVHNANEPDLIAGVATSTLEIVEERPDIDTIIVPIGGGSGAAGACIVDQALGGSLRVVGVQSEAAPAAHDSWREGRLVERPMGTFAEGVASRTAFELTQNILRGGLSDFVLVSEAGIRSAVRIAIATTRNLVEPAGALGIAAIAERPELFASRRVAVVFSGGNISPAALSSILAEDSAAPDTSPRRDPP